MKTWFVKLWTDDTAFVGIVRTLFAGAGALAISGELDGVVDLPKWAGVLSLMAASFIRSSSGPIKQ